MNFDFLKSVEVVAPTKKATTTTANKLPEGGMVIRVFANGKVYPSKELVTAAGLEYTNKDAENRGFGLDIFKSSDWSGFPADAPQQFLFVAAVSRALPKIDLFASCGYNEDGTPKASVTEQGGGSFGKTLVTMIQDTFGIEIPSGDFVDLLIKTDIIVKSPNDLYYVPKFKSRGDDKGTITVQRRESINICPFELLNADRFAEVVETEGDVNAAEAEASVETATQADGSGTVETEKVTQEEATEMVKSGEAEIPAETVVPKETAAPIADLPEMPEFPTV